MLAQRPRRSLGQVTLNAPFMDVGETDVAQFLVAQGLVLAYTGAGALLYGKNKVLDKVILGLGIPTFAWASFSGFKLLYQKGDYNPFNGVVGILFGAVDALATIGAVLALNKKSTSRSAIEAVSKAIPI